MATGSTANLTRRIELPTTDLAGLDMGFEAVEGFSRPNWKGVWTFIKEQIPEEEREMAWRHVVAQWLEELTGDLGGNTQVYETTHFFCVSDLGAETSTLLLDYAESAINSIRGFLKAAAWSGYPGKQVLLFFSEHDDYYAYLSHFYQDGTHILTAGVFLPGGYPHIALPYKNLRSAQRTLAHELVHNLLCHLPIPNWLNEGLAVTIEGRLARTGWVLAPDFADRHRAHWNEANIQRFWAGKSYGVPGDESELSYDLGQIIVNLLTGNAENFIHFIRHADARDAGQDAAVNFLNLDLGEVLGGFLGPGNWRPRRKAIAECWKQADEPK